MEYGSDRFPGFVVRWTRFLLSVADRDRRRVRNRQFWHLGVFADLSWAARCWKMDRVAKRFCKHGRCGRTRAHWVYRGLARHLSITPPHHRASLTPICPFPRVIAA